MHWIHNIRKKPFRGLGAILDCWDRDADGDFIYLQEVLCDEGGLDSGTSVIKGIDRGQHSVVLWGSEGRTHRTAIAIHGRWAGNIAGTIMAGRPVSTATLVHPLRHV